MKSTVQNSNIKQGEYRTLISGPFYKCELYNDAGEVVLSQWLEQQQNLDNSTQELDCMPFQQGVEGMATKINRVITIDGVKRWIHANSEQEYADKLMKLLNHEPQETGRHLFGEYAWNWFETYSKPNIETVTATTYRRQLTHYLLPAFEGMAVEDITTDEVQRLFNSMDTAKATKDKVKIVLNQILEAAKDDKLIADNPLKSKRLRITGKASKATQPYSVEEMRYLIQHIPEIRQPVDRAYMAIQALHPMRLEEVLGLQWADIDTEISAIHIRRAVTHPTRNQPEVKCPKTESSIRTIGLSPLAVPYLIRGGDGDFIFGGSNPLSYTQVRRMCDRIRKDTGFAGRVTPIRFRTTVLTDIYDQTKDIKLTQAAAGHASADMTLKYYVKGRENIANATAAVGTVYTT